MIYIEAPELYKPAPGDGPSIFLAGGITGCPDWQRETRTLIADQPVVVLNPRRAHYRPEHGDTLAQQVAWEYHHLQLADHTLFWFPPSNPTITVQPIALLELDTALAETRLAGRRITIGADPRYPADQTSNSSSTTRYPDTPCTQHCPRPSPLRWQLPAATTNDRIRELARPLPRRRSVAVFLTWPSGPG